MEKEKRSAGIALLFLCWIVYACSYVGKVNYAANINQIMAFYQIDHSTAGLVSTFFFFAYGVGQVVNGIFCKKYNLKWVVFCSLVVSATVNLLVGLTNNFAIVKFLWLLNGFSMSILWPSLIRLLSESLPRKHMPKASMVMGTTVATGTFIVYGLSAIFVKINFKLSFFVPTVLFLVVAFAWLFLSSKFITKAKSESEEEELVATQTTMKKQENFNKKLLILSIVTLAVYGVATNLVVDGLTTWIPSILKEEYHLDASFSIILTLVLPCVSIFGNAFAVKMHKKIPDFVVQCAVMFLFGAIIIAGVIAGVELKQFVTMLLGFAVVRFLIGSCNSIITSIFPLYMRGKINSGLFAGVLNGFCYLGSTISSYGLGEIADNYGWITVFWVLFAVSLFVVAVAGGYLLLKRFLRTK